MDFNKLSRENGCIEYKLCAHKLPGTFWETYSAFANTAGGTIILGVQENAHHAPTIEGVVNPEKIITDLFSTASSLEKVNLNLLKEENISIETSDDKKFICIIIPEAPMNKKPVYLKKNMKLTYIRKYDGDHIATDEELRAFVRNTFDNIDSELLDGYDINDLHFTSIINFRTLIQERNPSTDYSQMNPTDFLRQMGLFGEDKNDGGKIKLTLGGLLFLGKYQSIINKIPHFHLDYFDKRGNSERWRDRVAAGDLLYPELNVFSYYWTIYSKLKSTIEEPFKLDKNIIRKSAIELDVALREALVNMLIHADYREASTSLTTEVHDAYYIFINPGIMKISPKEFFTGGISKPRNHVLTTLFRKMGVSERAGSGGPKIYDVVNKNQFRMPELETNLEKTILKLWGVELEHSYPELSANAKAVYLVLKDPSNTYSSSQIQDKTKLSRHYLRQALKELEDKDLIIRTGQKKSQKYTKKMSNIELISIIDRGFKHAKDLLLAYDNKEDR